MTANPSSHTASHSRATWLHRTYTTRPPTIVVAISAEGSCSKSRRICSARICWRCRFASSRGGGREATDPLLPRARTSRPRRSANRQRLITTRSLNGGGVRGRSFHSPRRLHGEITIARADRCTSCVLLACCLKSQWFPRDQRGGSPSVNPSPMINSRAVQLPATARQHPSFACDRMLAPRLLRDPMEAAAQAKSIRPPGLYAQQGW